MLVLILGGHYKPRGGFQKMKNLTVLLILTALLVAGCAGTKWVQTDVVRQHDFVVTLEQRQDQGAAARQEFGQPAQLALAELKILLEELSYVEKSGKAENSKQSPVFQAGEVDRLAPVLAAALEKADGSQRIRFISFNLEPAVIFSVSRKTEGVVFVGSDGRLNIAFNYINAKRHANETSAMFISQAVADPLAIASADSVLAPAPPYAQLRELESGKQAPLWVVVDLAKLKEAISAGAVPTRKVTAAAAPTVASPAGTVPGTPAPAPAAAELRQEEIKSKLKFLKELLSEGLISEQDYTARKAELLDRIN
jgi:hypothetical protein